MVDRDAQLAEWRQLVDDCIRRESRLTDFERNFVQSISERLDAGLVVSVKQSELLSDIWDKATAKG